MDCGMERGEKRDFGRYFMAHYAPLLKKLAEWPYDKIRLSDREWGTLSLMEADLVEIFGAES